MNNNRIITSDIISIFYQIRLNAFSFLIVKKPLDLEKNKKYLLRKIIIIIVIIIIKTSSIM